MLIAKDTGLLVNIESYQLLEEPAKEKSRSAQVVQHQEAEENLFANFVKKHGAAKFVGYAELAVETEIIALVKDGVFVENLYQGDEGWILLKETPFYAEKGGQVGDKGKVFRDKNHFHVDDCQTPFPGVIVHIGKMEEGSLAVGEKVSAKIGEEDVCILPAITQLPTFCIGRYSKF